MVEGSMRAPEAPLQTRKSEAEERAVAVKKKRKIRFELPKFTRKKKELTTSPHATSAIDFMTPRQLHRARGYEQYGMKSKHKETTSEQHVVHDAEPVQRKHDEAILTQEVESEYNVSHSHHAKSESSFVQKVKDRAEDFQWMVGKLTRGDIRKRLRVMEQDPFAHKNILQAELQRSFNTMSEKSTPQLFDERTKFQAGITVAASVLPPFPISVVFIGPIPVPIVYSLGTIAVAGVDNIPNTWKAIREKRYRKASAYAGMTALGLLTGFIPMSHHLTNTLYAEVLQRPFDHAETHGMLQIVSSLLADDAHPNRKALGQQLVATTLVDYYAKNGNQVHLVDQLLQIREYEEAKKGDLITKRELLMQQRDRLPERKKLLARLAILGNFKEMRNRIGIAAEHFRLGQELITVEHKLHTIPQLLEIIHSGIPSPAQQEVA